MIKKILFSVIFFTAIFSFALQFARADECIPPCSVTLPNPLGTTDTVWKLIDTIITALRDKIAPPIVGLMVIYGAFQILFAGGEPEKFKTGRKTILYAVIGYAIIFVASGIDLIIKDFFSLH